MNQTIKHAINMGLIILAVLVMVVGLLICYSLKGDQQFMIGVVIVGVGCVLVSLIRDFSKGVGS
jgi:uncharacterized membrane protein